MFRNRRLLAALLFCLATAIAVESLVPPQQVKVGVVAAARDLAAGTVLTSSDLTTVDLPSEAIPSHSFTAPSAVLGEQLATPVHSGNTLTTSSFVGAGLLTGAPPGTVAVPLRPADRSTVQLLSPGQHVEVVLTTGNGFEIPADTAVLARGLPVLWTSTSGGSTSAAWPGSSDGDGLVVVAADPEDAAALAGAASNGSVHLVLTAAPPGKDHP